MATTAKSRTTPEPARPRATGAQRTLLFMMAAAFGLTLVAFILLLIKAFAHLPDGGANEGFWRLVYVLPLVAMPIGILLIIAVLIVSIVRRSRAARDA